MQKRPQQITIIPLSALIIITSVIFLIQLASHPTAQASPLATSQPLAKLTSPTSNTTLQVTTTAALSLTYGLQLTLPPAPNTPTYLTDLSPQSESIYRVQFRLDPNSIPLTNTTPITIIAATNDNLTIQQPIFALTLEYSNTTYILTATYLDQSSNNTYQSLTPIPLTDAPHHIQLTWEGAFLGNNSGQLTLIVDNNTSKVGNHSVSNIGIDQIHFGAVSHHPAVAGQYYLDDFQSYRTLPATNHYHSNEIFSDNFESGNLSAWSLPSIEQTIYLPTLFNN